MMLSQITTKFVKTSAIAIACKSCGWSIEYSYYVKDLALIFKKEVYGKYNPCKILSNLNIFFYTFLISLLKMQQKLFGAIAVVVNVIR